MLGKKPSLIYHNQPLPKRNQAANMSRACRKLLSNFLATFLYFEQRLFSFRATVCIPSDFKFSINSQKSEQLSGLEFALLPYFTIFQYRLAAKEKPVAKSKQEQTMTTQRFLIRLMKERHHHHHQQPLVALLASGIHLILLRKPEGPMTS